MPAQHHTTPASDPARFILVTLGFTHSDRARDYSSFTDGYRLGARQTAVTIAVDTTGTVDTSVTADTAEPTGVGLGAEQWAEAVYVAFNAPTPPPPDPTTPADRAVAAIRAAVTTQVRFPLRSFSVGDTVTVAGVMLACQPAGWQPVGWQPVGWQPVGWQPVTDLPFDPGHRTGGRS